MKCPKCKKEMIGVVSGLNVELGETCFNKLCWFYGIVRMVEKKDGADNGT